MSIIPTRDHSLDLAVSESANTTIDRLQRLKVDAGERAASVEASGILTAAIAHLQATFGAADVRDLLRQKAEACDRRVARDLSVRGSR